MAGQPAFIHYDSKEREIFLSQVGNFTPAEREIFHKLCRMWEPEISYNRFSAAIFSNSANAKSDLAKLLDKLKAERHGLITTVMQNGERIPQGIVVCEQGELIFYVKLVEELMTDVQETPTSPLPSQERLAELGFPPPGEYLVDTTFEELALRYSAKAVQGPGILRITLPGGGAYLVSEGQVKRFVTLAIAQAQGFFQSPSLLAAMAALKNASLMDMKRQLNGRVPDFWLDTAERMLKHRKQLETHRKVTIPQGFFSLMAFIAGFITQQVEQAKNAKKADQERRTDLRTLAEHVKEHPGFAMPDKDFAEKIMSFKEKYGDDYSAFRDEFEQTYVIPESGKNLPPVLHVEGHYIHSVNLHTFFLSRINRLSPELMKIYISLMTAYIKRGGKLDEPLFTSPESFENDIAEKVRIEDSLLYQLLQKPQTVAEAIIIASKQSSRVRSVEDMKLILASFFYPDKIKFKELALIFALDVREIYQHAFLRLSILRQIVTRLTGKHESFQRQFSEHVQKLYGNIARQGGSVESAEKRLGDAGGAPDDPEMIPSRPERTAESQGSSGRHQRTSRGSSKPQKAASKSATGAKAEIKKIPKHYSRTEQDSAWKQFSKVVKK
ncbi:hypothetical protein [Spirochaeta lutea]|uniref:Uncharacterized protein n=1 Tax=Spirochaeta lutea TaxID=1480694 RepID=A0A098QV21_9SPIO|nr:hypothetical protein [Spirochaeta lutea]KGE71401.1 hypothetical protein DC28_11420 [Spirochaeta lutea]